VKPVQDRRGRVSDRRFERLTTLGGVRDMTLRISWPNAAIGWVTPHVAQNSGRGGGSAIDAPTTRHAGYGISQQKRKRIEECFGWLKTIALLRKVRHRGIFKVDWVFTFVCAAYNLVRMRNPSGAAVQPG
jgi:hypothetical protein